MSGTRGGSGKQPYSKSYLTYEQQLDLLASRGMPSSNPESAVEALRRIGYYRLSGYVYPFRKIKPINERSSSTNYRYDEVVPGHTIEDSIDLYNFDQKLRSHILLGIDILETGIKALVAYHGGYQHPFIHITYKELNPTKSKVQKGRGINNFDSWMEYYNELLKRAKSEDLIRHNTEIYEKLPIWVATEVLDFGSLSRLFNLLPHNVQSRISGQLGINNGKSFAKWLPVINFVRNKCAHFSRVWNRTMTYKWGHFNENLFRPSLYHLLNRNDSKEHDDKIYPALAIITYLISFLQSDDEWRVRLVELLDEFPNIDGVSLEASMGFPLDWKSLDIWVTEHEFIDGSMTINSLGRRHEST
ncbi:Abi family protein [Corynebacterium lubricantis]|uniref:Abi family protein n=1 Tax=Corynebacterium lubricantis TaxID=541095 RepID=UPI0003A3A17C|nr:Abi family protein [Corynebacterium lubricantis]